MLKAVIINLRMCWYVFSSSISFPIAVSVGCSSSKGRGCSVLQRVLAGYFSCLIKMSCLERSGCLTELLKMIMKHDKYYQYCVILCNAHSVKLLTSLVILPVATIRSVLFSSTVINTGLEVNSNKPTTAS